MRNRNGTTNVCSLISTILFLISSIVRHTTASKCLVSKWQEWSECQGNCEFAQRVRNRDVLRPPFPERDERTGEFFLRECPPLYEVENCTPKNCADESPFAKFPSGIVKRLPTRASATSSSAVVSNENDHFLTTATIRRQHTTKTTTRNNEMRRAEAKPGVHKTDDPFGKSSSSEKHQPTPPSQRARSKVAGIEILGQSSSSGSSKTSQSSGSNSNSQSRPGCEHSNHSCCRVVNSRPTCAEGNHKPRQLIRWYRKKDDQFCRPYKYAFCGGDGAAGAANDLSAGRTTVVFASEAECLDTCFSDVEKAVLPNFRVI